MSEDLHSRLRKLNRLSKLYDAVITSGSPYRISRVRNLYEDLLNSLRKKYTISILDSQKYQILFGSDIKIASILEKKEKAIQARQYEIAAQLRDLEKSVLNLKLAELGFNVSENFLIIGEGIYQLPK